MKRWIALLLSLCCLLSLVACGQNNQSSQTPATTTPNTTGTQGATEPKPTETQKPTDPVPTETQAPTGEEPEDTIIVYLLSEEIYDEGYIRQYIYDDRGLMIKESWIFDGKEDLFSTWDYDEDGNLIKQSDYLHGEECYQEIIYDKDGNRIEVINYEDGMVESREIINYNQDGKETDSVFYFKGEENSREEYVYDEDGNPVEWIRYVNGVEVYRTVCAYDNENNTVTQYEYVEHDGSMDLTIITVLTYDQEDRLLQEAYYDPADINNLENAVPTSLYVYTYQDGKQVELLVYYNGKLERQSTMGYNDYGHQIRTRVTGYLEDSDQLITFETIYQLAYDENGNLIRYAQYNDGELITSYSCTYIAVKMSRELAEKMGYLD